MSDRNIVLFDGVGKNDVRDEASLVRNSNLYTDILLQDIETGAIIAKSLHNKVILPGGSLILQKLFDIDDKTIIWPSYNEELGIPDEFDCTGFPDYEQRIWNDQKVMLFCVGTNGCGTEGSQVFAVDYNSWITPDAIIPFRYVLSTNDITNREMYAGRTLVNDEYIAYYFKKFSAGPTLNQVYTDGTQIGREVINNNSDVESYVEMILTINKDECREFFVATTGIDECRFNSISLCYATKFMTEAGNETYKFIRPLTRLNIPNEYLIDATKGVNIIYHVYA